MERHLKERLTGASVLVLLGVIFIPMILDNSSEPKITVQNILPANNDTGYQSRIIPVDEQVTPEPRTEIVTADQENTVQASTQVVPATIAPQSNTSQQSANKDIAKQTIRSSNVATQSVTQSEAENNQGLSGWVVQLGSFSNQANAVGLVSSLQTQGFPAYIEEQINGSESTFRVKVGPELNRENAEKTQQALLGKVGINGIILSYP